MRRFYTELGGKTLRFYETGNSDLPFVPSVTTINSFTRDESYLIAWRERIGHEEAERISQFARDRGTIMHDTLETLELSDKSQLTSTYMPKEGLVEEKPVEAKSAEELVEMYRNKGGGSAIQRIILSETRIVYLKGRFGYAGTLDLLYEDIFGQNVLRDYKNSRKKKRPEWLEEYWIQEAAYWVPLTKFYGHRIDRAELVILADGEEKPQIESAFEMDIQHYWSIFVKRVKKFYEEVMPQIDFSQLIAGD